MLHVIRSVRLIRSWVEEWIGGQCVVCLKFFFTYGGWDPKWRQTCHRDDANFSGHGPPEFWNGISATEHVELS